MTSHSPFLQAVILSEGESLLPERTAESRPPGASVPLRADGSPVWAFRSPGLRIIAHVCLPEALPQWRLFDVGSSLTVARQLRFRTGFPWCPLEMLPVRSPPNLLPRGLSTPRWTCPRPRDKGQCRHEVQVSRPRHELLVEAVPPVHRDARQLAPGWPADGLADGTRPAAPARSAWFSWFVGRCSDRERLRCRPRCPVAQL